MFYNKVMYIAVSNSISNRITKWCCNKYFTTKIYFSMLNFYTTKATFFTKLTKEM